MKQHKNSFLIICIAFLFSSCASILNSKTTSINIATSQPATLVIQNDTINATEVGQKIEVARNKLPLNVKIIQDSTSKNINVFSRNSAAYYVNFVGLPAYGVPTLIGLIVDHNNPKRYAYPKTIYINSDDYSYKTSNLNNFTPYKTIIKTRPFSTLIKRNNPRLEIAFEARNNERWSTQFSAAYLLPEFYGELDYLKGGIQTGYSVYLEQRLYFKKIAPNGFYTSLGGTYTNRESDVTGELYEIPKAYSDSYIDTFHLSSTTSRLDLKVGYQKIVRHVVFDFFIGIGFAQTNNIHQGRIDSDDILGGSYSGFYGESWFVNSKKNEGQRTSLRLPIGFQIGWAF